MQEPHQSQSHDLTDTLQPSEIITEAGNDPQLFLKRDSPNLENQSEIRINPQVSTSPSLLCFSSCSQIQDKTDTHSLHAKTVKGELTFVLLFQI